MFSSLNWLSIISECESNNGRFSTKYNSLSGKFEYSSNADQIAHLTRYLGKEFNADYGTNGTGVQRNVPINWINKNANLKASTLSAFNDKKVAEAIKAGNIVYLRGNATKNGEGHAWVCDGGIIEYTNNKMSRLLIHCNWGFNGSYDGYFLSKVLDATNPIDSDSALDYSSSLYFKYNVQYSIVKQK